MIRFSLRQCDPALGLDGIPEITVHADAGEFFRTVGGSDEEQGLWVSLNHRTADAEMNRPPGFPEAPTPESPEP